MLHGSAASVVFIVDRIIADSLLRPPLGPPSISSSIVRILLVIIVVNVFSTVAPISSNDTRIELTLAASHLFVSTGKERSNP